MVGLSQKLSKNVVRDILTNDPFPVMPKYVRNVNRIRDVTFGVRLGACSGKFPIEIYGDVPHVRSHAASVCCGILLLSADRCEFPESAYSLILVGATWDEVYHSCVARNRATIRA